MRSPERELQETEVRPMPADAGETACAEAARIFIVNDNLNPCVC